MQAPDWRRPSSGSRRVGPDSRRPPVRGPRAGQICSVKIAVRRRGGDGLGLRRDPRRRRQRGVGARRLGEHVEAIRPTGSRRGRQRGRAVRINATSDAAEVGVCDLVVMATKAQDVEIAARRATPLLGPDTVVLPIQNGLGSADRIASVSARRRWRSGSRAGSARRSSSLGTSANGWGLVRLGGRHGPATPRIHRIAEVWADAGFRVQAYDAVDRLVWEKLIFNVTFSGTCAVLGARSEKCQDPSLAGRVACGTEAYAVARRAGSRSTWRPHRLCARVRREDLQRAALGAPRRDGRPAVRDRHDQRRDPARGARGRAHRPVN